MCIIPGYTVDFWKRTCNLISRVRCVIIYPCCVINLILGLSIKRLGITLLLVLPVSGLGSIHHSSKNYLDVYKCKWWISKPFNKEITYTWLQQISFRKIHFHIDISNSSMYHWPLYGIANKIKIWLSCWMCSSFHHWTASLHKWIWKEYREDDIKLARRYRRWVSWFLETINTIYCQLWDWCGWRPFDQLPVSFQPDPMSCYPIHIKCQVHLFLLCSYPMFYD